jgi:dephospho-CoA kinase
MLVVGLTGGIGMGKSTAAAAFRRARVPVFDADATVHRLQSRNGPALPAIARAFPGTVKDGRLDRAALRRQVLADPAARRRLEAILHPLVRAAQHRFIARARGAPIVVLDIPLLFETGGDRGVDHVVVVSAPRAIQVARVRARRKMSDSEIAAIIALQMPDAAKRARADTIIRTGLSRHHATTAISRFLKARKAFFFEKKKQKTFARWRKRKSANYAKS